MRRKKADIDTLRGSGDVFADLGFADAPLVRLKSRVANEIARTLERRALSTRAAARMLARPPPIFPAFATRTLIASRLTAWCGSPRHSAAGWRYESPKRPDGRRCNPDQAAALRLTARRASTSATVSSTTALRMPFCAAIACTSRSTLSILGAPANSARAAEEGRTSPCAAAAYFSNGTRLSGEAPSLMQSSRTQS